MNTSAVQYSSEPWSRRCSIESILSIQGKETDFVRDSTDTELSDDAVLEFEPCTDAEEDAPALGRSSDESDNDIIATKVIEVSVCDEGDLEFADSEQTDTDGFDSEVELCDYWNCAQCGATNNNPMYRYCEACYKVRKNFFPPRPKRKNKRKLTDREDSRPLSQRRVLFPLSQEKDRLSAASQESDQERDRKRPLSKANDSQEKDRLSALSHESDLPSLSQENDSQLKVLLPSLSQGNLSQEIGHAFSSQDKDTLRSLSQDSGFDSQELSDPTQGTSGMSQEIKTVMREVRLPMQGTSGLTQEIRTVINEVRLSSNNNIERPLKRRAESADRKAKRIRVELSSESDSDSDTKVSPLVKTVSDPSLTVENVKVTKKILSDAAKEVDKDNNMCIVCLSEPKSGIFVHGRIAHICCCYKCAVKVWAKAKRCPVCNCKVSNVLRAVVM